MGYYTRYELEAEPWPDELSRMIENEEGVGEELAYALNPDGSTRDSARWYEHEAHMAQVSRIFPDTTFTLRGEGEVSGDAWIKHFRNGKVYPPFDPDGFR